MKIGVWIHEHDLPLEPQIRSTAKAGFTTLRCYSYDYARKAAPIVKEAGLNLLGGMYVDSEGLLTDWRSQLRFEELEQYKQLGIALDGICVGNELREGGDEPGKKRFTARLSFGLTNLIQTYRLWMQDHEWEVPLTYAMEGIVLDEQGRFYEWLWPLIEACDLVGINLYPMGNEAWFTFGAFEESRRFLQEPRCRHDRLVQFEFTLRRVLQALEPINKPLILTETGFPSAIAYEIQNGNQVYPKHDTARFAEAMFEFVSIITRVNREYNNLIHALYFYEWRDNLYHPKIWNVEQSPIHTAFGLCEQDGTPKLDLPRLVKLATQEALSTN